MSFVLPDGGRVIKLMTSTQDEQNIYLQALTGVSDEKDKSKCQQIDNIRKERRNSY